MKQTSVSVIFFFVLGLCAAGSATGANVSKSAPGQLPKLTEIKSGAPLANGDRKFTFVLPGVVIRGRMAELRTGDDGRPSYVFRLKKGESALFMPSKGKLRSRVVMPRDAHIDAEYRKL